MALNQQKDIMSKSEIKKVLAVMLLLLMISPTILLKAQNVNVRIEGIRSEKGQIVIGVFKDSESYLKEEPFVNKIFAKEPVTDGGMSVSFSLEPGIYGLCLLDDENSNGKMEYNFLGMPKEGFGFSDLYHTGITRPKFDSFSFTKSKDGAKNIKIRVRYIL
jgi:uncharacterized protein (DUF2141 family)